ncbi:MAG: class I SAM-dependent methyltransferase, partial [Bdellovibrionales bacterium]|nr:class I SAM-dependent methyltransferase [Bdellovibrionales bacterium]
MTDSASLQAFDNYSSLGEDPSRSCAETSNTQVIREIVRKRGLYGLGEQFAAGKIELTAIDQTIFNIITDQATPRPTRNARIWLHYLFDRLFNPQQGSRAFRIGEVHYGIGNELFKKMLGPSMTYTCGYWANAKTLEEAQNAKLDLI